MASCARLFVLVADARKQQPVLGRAWRAGVPLEIVPCAWGPVRARLAALGGRPTLRMAVRKAGPVVTDNGGWLVDCDFGELPDPAALDAQLRAIVGVVETGLFVGMAQVAFFGREDGSVVELRRPTKQ